MTIINSVIKGGGTTPTGTKSITANGVYDVTDFASADVQVPTTAPAHYIEKTVDANGKLISGATNAINLNGVTDISDCGLYYAYHGGAVVGNVDFSSLINISGQNACYMAFYLCQGITSVNLSSLTTVSGYNSCNQMFLWCTGITSIDLSSLTTVSGNNGCRSMFGSCTSLTSVDLSSLTTISGSYGCGQMFTGCTSLTSVDLSSLTTVSGQSGCFQMFNGCTLLTTLSFPALKTVYNNLVFENMLQGVTGCTVHFPSNMQSVVEGMTGYSTTTPFGALAGTVLFDLPATNLLTGVNTTVYERNPKYDTQTALAWRKQDTGTAPNLVIDWTPFYTSGLTDPTVGTTIYSDSACTTAVTTVDSIA